MPAGITGRLARFLVGCYPRRWRERYAEEMLAVLGQYQPTARTVLSLWTGAVSAHLSPESRWTQLPAVLPGCVMDAVGEQLEIGAMLQRVARMLVPQFADHCCIDVFQGDALIRRVQRNAGGWTPPAGTWAQAGERIRYPRGHFCQQAMAGRDTVIVTGLDKDRGKRYPPPSSGSFAAAKQAGITSVLAAPLQARGVLLGVLSLGLSDLTGRADRNYAAADRDLIGAIAGQVAVAIDTAITGPASFRPEPARLAAGGRGNEAAFRAG